MECPCSFHLHYSSAVAVWTTEVELLPVADMRRQLDSEQIREREDRL
jgi:hypothetical protein